MAIPAPVGPAVVAWISAIVQDRARHQVNPRAVATVAPASVFAGRRDNVPQFAALVVGQALNMNLSIGVLAYLAQVAAFAAVVAQNIMSVIFKPLCFAGMVKRGLCIGHGKCACQYKKSTKTMKT